MKTKRKIGYVSLEIVIICAVVLTAGIGGIAHFWTDGKSNQSTMVEKQEEVYYAAWNGIQGGTGNNIGGEIIKTKEAILVKGSDFYPKIPSATTSIIFTDLQAPENVTLTDVSFEQDDSIVLWCEGTVCYISSQRNDTLILLNENSSSMFYNLSNVSNIEFNNIKTSITTSMASMFYKTGFNSTTPFKITGMNNWDVSNVTDMKYMFSQSGYNSSSWSVGDLSNWDTGNVTTMEYMFQYAGYKSSVIDISGLKDWDVTSLVKLNYIFTTAWCNAEDFSLDLSGWDISNATRMVATFENIGTNAKNFYLNVSGWDTQNITSMNYTFSSAGYSATNWKIEGISEFDVSKVTNMEGFLSTAGNNANIFDIGDLGGWNVSSVTTMKKMFNACGQKATTFNIGDLSGWDTRNVKNMFWMFDKAGSSDTAWTQDLSSWNVDKVTNYSYFGNSSKIKYPNF